MANLQAFNQAAAAKFKINLSQIGQILASIQDHPEILQIIDLAAKLRGNPNLVGQLQAQAGKALISALVGLDGVADYVLATEKAAGVQPSPLFLDLHAAVEKVLKDHGQQALAAPANAPLPPEAAPAQAEAPADGRQFGQGL